MVLNIIFSFNRAMQLDYFLTSGLQRLKFETETVVIYHTTGEHAAGYAKLIEKFSKYPHIRFEERTPNRLNAYQKIKFSKDKRERFLKLDNFKDLMEKIMRKSKCEFVMFNTDDGFWTDDVYFDKEVQNLIRLNPSSVTYRMYVGDNLEGFPDFVKRWGNYYLWDYYADDKVTHWTYPFAIDATIYSRTFLLAFLKKNWYTNPIDLEHNILVAARKEKVLGIGLSAKQALIIGTILNRVSTVSANPTANIDVNKLNDKYLDDYQLHLEFSLPNSQVNLVPLVVDVYKGDKMERLYEFDQYGEMIQSQYSAEGSKTQMP